MCHVAIADDDAVSDIFLGASRVADSKTINLDEIFGSKPRTVYIPGRYYRNGKGALFLDGKRFATQGGQANVAGFLSGDGKGAFPLMVAVYEHIASYGSSQTTARTQEPLFSEEELKKLPPELRLKALDAMKGGGPSTQTGITFGSGTQNSLVFYRCNAADSCSVHKVVKGTPSVTVADGTIWYADPSLASLVGRENEYKEWANTYFGIKLDGTQVDGPVNALFAIPLKNGNWFVRKFISSTYKLNTAWVIRKPDGSERELFQRSDWQADLVKPVLAEHIYVNRDPISNVYEHGNLPVVTTLKSMGSGYTRRIHSVCLLNATKEPYYGEIPSVYDPLDQLGMDGAQRLASQMVTLPYKGGFGVFGQINNSGGGIIGVKKTECSEGAPHVKTEFAPYARISEGGFFSQKFFVGSNGGLHIDSPAGNVLVLPEWIKKGAEHAAIRIEDSARISSSQARAWMDRYGLMID